MSGTPKARRAAAAPAAGNPGGAPPLGDDERSELQALLDALPPPLEPFDVSVLDGFLCGVLVQPQPVPADRWLRHVTDSDGRPLPPTVDAGRLHALVMRRHAELEQAIGRRAWFDPWVYESAPAAGAPADEPPAHDADDVYPWVAGFATALELFPALMAHDAAAALTPPLALLYRHLDPDDLEDADELLAEIESMEPPVDLADAVEGLVRATLLLADVGRPLAAAAGPSRPRSRPRRATR